ncbi:2Fe-2S iron-sulfur cluster-binding protein [Alicyclobacillus suci]|uniref:2Fe-2S iron-sulfur cluster-binding protein n=1 Tax=Alicyclobacillus suci TaxID=2816080 RepID=UPI002E2C2598|nr:2Fe-2S iron-sulfur cluster binding domain-containing protein [Alicyclobacillus suci]
MFTVQIVDGQWKDAVFVCDDQESLLDAARKQGIKISFGCRGGGCGMCKVKVQSGYFERGVSSKAVLPDEERVLNYTLACKTYPRSNLCVSMEAVDT